MSTTEQRIPTIRGLWLRLPVQQREVGSSSRRLRLPADPRFLLLVASLAVGAWLLGLKQVDIGRMGDLGIAPLLPFWGLAGLALLSIVFCVAIVSRQRSVWLLAALQVATVVLLYGLAAMVEKEARFPPVWRHVGLVDYVVRHQSVDTRLDGYFSWPGFFIILAFLTNAAGLGSASSLLSVANWAPVFFNLLYALALFAVYSSLNIGVRVSCLAIWFFLINNWTDQDYMAPQALAFLLYLAMVGILLRHFRTAAPWPPWLAQRVNDSRSGSPAAGRRRLVLLISLLAVFAATVVSHPLTPIMAISATAVLVVFAGVRPWWLPIVMLVMVAGWDAVMMRDFVSGHPQVVTDVFAGIKGKVDENVTSRIVGSPEHMFIVRLRVVTAAAVWGLAGLSLLRLLKQGSVSLSSLLLMVAPIPLLFLQGYGGEMFIRVQLFALPFLSLFAAQLLYPLRMSGMFHGKALVLLLTSMLMVFAFLFTRYGNERHDYVSPLEVQAVQRMYALAPPGSDLVWWPYVPAMNRDFERYQYDNVTPQDLQTMNVRGFRDRLASRHRDTYILFTRNAKAYVDMASGLPPGSLDRFERALERSPDFQVVYANKDAEVLILRSEPTKKP